MKIFLQTKSFLTRKYLIKFNEPAKKQNIFIWSRPRRTRWRYWRFSHAYNSAIIIENKNV